MPCYCTCIMCVCAGTLFCDIWKVPYEEWSFIRGLLIDGGKSDPSILNKIMGDWILCYHFHPWTRCQTSFWMSLLSLRKLAFFSDCLKGEGNVESSLQWTVHLSPWVPVLVRLLPIPENNYYLEGTQVSDSRRGCNVRS
jgi:hypothetical protein